jgi:hypothetical protein
VDKSIISGTAGADEAPEATYGKKIAAPYRCDADLERTEAVILRHGLTF